MAYRELFEAQKALVSVPAWSEPQGETRVSWFDAPLDIGGVVEAGFILHSECRLDLPDQNVGFDLQIRLAGQKRKISIARLDWLSIKGGHSNPRRTGWPFSGIRAPATHYHDFEINYDETNLRMLGGDLPFARAITEQLQTFEQARDSAGFLFRINNIGIVQPPKWEYDMFRYE